MTARPTALLLIDVQQGFDDPAFGPSRSNTDFKDNIIKILEYFREQGALIIHVQHNSIHPESPFYPSKRGVEFYEFSRPLPDEVVVKKDVNSAFIGTNLEQILRDRDVRRLYCVGLTIDQCVSTTVRMASNMRVCDRGEAKGEIILIGDATTGYGYDGIDAKTIHQVHEATLAHEFCTVIQTADLIR